MRLLYNIALYLLTPFVVVKLLWRSIKSPAYRFRIEERFGKYTDSLDRPVIWVHAVSVGETIAAAPLINYLLESYPEHQMVVTTTTPTGGDQVASILSDKVKHYYAPYDLPGTVKSFLQHIKPDICIVMETEIWPNLFHACADQSVPVVLANARMSEKSARGYQKLASLTRSTLACIDTIAAQGEMDARRFITLGANADQVVATGSIKFDLEIQASLRESAESLRQELGPHRNIWIAASTHEGEDELVLDAFLQIQHSINDALLVLVPRHPDRFDKVAALCEKRKIPMIRRSSHQPCAQNTQVYLADSMGELLMLYAASDVAFIGGSLVDNGGHNLLEPAALAIPSVVGPYMYNFEEICSLLIQHKGVEQVTDKSQLAATVEMLFRDTDLRLRMGENARTFVEQNRGSLQKLESIIDGVLG